MHSLLARNRRHAYRFHIDDECGEVSAIYVVQLIRLVNKVDHKVDPTTRIMCPLRFSFPESQRYVCLKGIAWFRQRRVSMVSLDDHSSLLINQPHKYIKYATIGVYENINKTRLPLAFGRNTSRAQAIGI